MFKLGEFYEEDAKPIVGYLKDAGIRVEQKAFICSLPYVDICLEGRLSELRSEIKDIEKYERYLGALKAVLAKGAPAQENLRDLFYSELDPAWAEKRRRAEEILKIPTQSLTDEEKEDIRNKLKEAFNDINTLDLVEMSKAYSFAITTLIRNEIDQGKDLGDRLDDPILRIKVDPEEYKDHKLLKRTMHVELEKRYELYIDEFSAPLYDEIDEEFQDDYEVEFFKIKTLGMLVEDLVQEPAPGKIDIEEFAERCNIQLESDGNLLEIDGSCVAEDIARALEKNGVVKVKGHTIKWKA